MTTQDPLQRDVLIDTLYQAACRDRNIRVISADLGAMALDRFREDLPDQFVHAGISEQNMIDLACGLAMTGKNVICYAMACFITTRCFEQIKCAIGIMNQVISGEHLKQVMIRWPQDHFPAVQ